MQGVLVVLEEFHHSLEPLFADGELQGISSHS